MKRLAESYNLVNVPHGGLGSNVEAWMNGISYDPNLANSSFGGSF